MTSLPFSLIGTLRRVTGLLVSVLTAVILASSAQSIPVAIVSASALHAAAPVQKIVVPPMHRAAALLAVVDQSDILPKHRTLADRVLRGLPPACRTNLQHFYVNYDKHPSNRGLGGASTIIVTGIVPDSEFMALIVHECGHVADIGGLGGTDTLKPTPYFDGSQAIYGDDPSVQFYQISWISSTMMIPGLMKNDFVSGYAMSDAFEDFAETYAYYALHQKEFAERAKKNAVLRDKYNFMATVVFAKSPAIATGTSKVTATVPWDVTKLPYVWHAKR